MGVYSSRTYMNLPPTNITDMAINKNNPYKWTVKPTIDYYEYFRHYYIPYKAKPVIVADPAQM
jgi:hypothetical protein